MNSIYDESVTPLIELSGITKDYGGFRALDGVSLAIQPGVTGLLGPNGAGKSTLIKVLLGLLRASGGTGRVLEYDIANQVRQIRAHVGYMPEDDCYLYGLSGIESVQFSAQLSRIPRVEALRRAHEILDFCGMGQERYRTVETYSTGMRQKLRFAQALVHDPPLLILDEPTSGLDPDERDSMLNRIRRLATDHGKGILICTHILPDVQTVSDSIVILARGQVRVNDTLQRLRQTDSPSYRVRVAGNSAKFAEHLVSIGLDVQGSDDMLVVSGTDASVSDRLWEAANLSGTTLRSVNPSRNSLQDIFMSAIAEQR